MTLALGGLLLLSLFGIAAPASVRCAAPPGLGCPGGLLGPAPAASTNQTQWFDVTLYDYGFWIVNDLSGVNESSNWTFLAGYTIHINATSEPPNSAVGGTGAHGLGILGGGINLQLYTSVGAWSNISFVAPTTPASGILVYCTNYCGSGHSGMQVSIVSIATPESPPVPQMTAVPTNGTIPLTVNFSGQASGGIAPYTFVWNFGDGGRTAGANASHVYAQAGQYRAELVVYDANGLAGNVSTLIHAEPPPTLHVTITPPNATGAAPLTVTLTATTTGGNGPYTYNWVFGDGSTGTGSIVQHTYAARGQYYAQAIATDTGGLTGDAFASILVTSVVSTPLVLLVTLSTAEGDLPLNVSGVASVSGGGGSYGPVQWDWGDGSPPDQGLTAAHLYSGLAPGAVTVSVATSDSIGQSAFQNLTVQLDPSPAGAITLDPFHPEVPVNVTAHLALTGGNGTFGPVLWDFGDGVTLTGGVVVTHRYTQGGAFHLTASSRDSTGAPITSSAWVNLSRPVATHSGSGAVLSGDSNPLYFMAAFAGLGIVALVASAYWERREPPRVEAAPSTESTSREARISPELRPRARSSRIPAAARGVAPALAALFGGAVLYWAWPLDAPTPAYAVLWGTLGMLLWAGIVATVLAGVAVPHLRHLARPGSSRGAPVQFVATVVGFSALWMVLAGQLAGPAGLPVSGGSGIAVLPLHTPFGPWPSIEFLLPGGSIQGYLSPETIGSAAIVGCLSTLLLAEVRAARSARPVADGRTRRRSLGATWGAASGALAWLPVLAWVAGCCSTPWLFRVGGAALSASLIGLGSSADLLDGGVWLATVGGLLLALRPLVRDSPRSGPTVPP